MMTIIQQVTWYNVLFLVIGGAAGGGMIVLFLLKWLRFKPMDDATVQEKRAKVKRMGVETDLLISTETMKLVEYFKKEIARQADFLKELQEDLNEERQRNEDAARRNSHLQEALDQQKEVNRQMAIEIEQLKVKISIYERNRHP